MTYVLVLYSTFLTRSGILGDASVHSFVDPGMTVYLFLIIFLGLFAVIGIGMIIYRWKYLTEHFSFEENILSRELALFTGSVALIASAIIVMVGTSAPIFGNTVETKFYNELNLPIAIIIGLLNGLSILLKWKSTDGKDLWRQSRFAVFGTIVLTALIIVFGGVHNFMLILMTFSSAFALFVNGEIAYKIFRGRKSFVGAYIAHIGISLFFVGVLATAGHSDQTQVELVKGEKVNVLGHDLTFTGYEPFDDGKKYHFNIEVSDGGSSRVVQPIMFVADFNNSLMREPDILVGFTKDFYVAPVSYDDGSNISAGGTTATFKQDTKFEYEGKEITFNKFNLPKDMSAMMGGGSFKIGVDLTVKANGKEYKLEPYMENSGQGPVYTPTELPEENLKVNITSMNASNAEVVLAFSPLKENPNSTKSQPKEILTVDASTKPFISLVWIGVLTMVAGFIISAFRRSKESLVS
jgi:cytochrome c-type biogenesis protein CcmF